MKNNQHSKKLIIAMLTLLFIRVIFFILNQAFGIYILVFNINQSAFNLVINITIIIMAAILILNLNIKKLFKYLTYPIAVLSILLLIFFTSPLFGSDKSYFYYDAPDKSHTLVVEENSWLLGGWSDFYKRTGFIFIKDLKNRIFTDDGYRPFTNNHYDLNWKDDTSAELSYDNGNGTYEKVTVNFN